jgi:hypothetical protein
LDQDCWPCICWIAQQEKWHIKGCWFTSSSSIQIRFFRGFGKGRIKGLFLGGPSRKNVNFYGEVSHCDNSSKHIRIILKDQQACLNNSNKHKPSLKPVQSLRHTWSKPFWRRHFWSWVYSTWNTLLWSHSQHL